MESKIAVLTPAQEVGPATPPDVVDLCVLEGLAATAGADREPAVGWSDIPCSAEGPGDCTSQKCRNAGSCTYWDFQRDIAALITGQLSVMGSSESLNQPTEV